MRMHRCVMDLQKKKTHDKFLPGPKGELCILSDDFLDDQTYPHDCDDNGQCDCTLCKEGKYARAPCRCQGENRNSTECVLIAAGEEYMNKQNHCSQPYKCALSCGSNQEIVSECSSVADLVCKCNDVSYDTGVSEGGVSPEKCLEKLQCEAGKEPVPLSGSDLQGFHCQTCQDGFYKDKDDASSCIEGEQPLSTAESLPPTTASSPSSSQSYPSSTPSHPSPTPSHPSPTPSHPSPATTENIPPLCRLCVAVLVILAVSVIVLLVILWCCLCNSSVREFWQRRYVSNRSN